MKTMDKILVVVGVTLFIFTITMLVTFFICGAIPDTLCTCVFACLGTECGVMGWIKTVKEKYREKEEYKLKEKEDDENGT